jgi:hypothetical protein
VFVPFKLFTFHLAYILRYIYSALTYPGGMDPVTQSQRTICYIEGVSTYHALLGPSFTLVVSHSLVVNYSVARYKGSRWHCHLL